MTQQYEIPRDPITLSNDDWGVKSPPKRKVFWFHETILSDRIPRECLCTPGQFNRIIPAVEEPNTSSSSTENGEMGPFHRGIHLV